MFSFCSEFKVKGHLTQQLYCFREVILTQNIDCAQSESCPLFYWLRLLLPKLHATQLPVMKSTRSRCVARLPRRQGHRRWPTRLIIWVSQWRREFHIIHTGYSLWFTAWFTVMVPFWMPSVPHFLGSQFACPCCDTSGPSVRMTFFTHLMARKAVPETQYLVTINRNKWMFFYTRQLHRENHLIQRMKWS